MTKQEELQEKYPFLTGLEFNDTEFVGIVQNKDQKGWSLDRKDWEVLNESLTSLDLDWKSIPLRKSLKEN